MTFNPIENFDQGRIPDVNDETSFHDDARYVFAFLSSVVIPGMNAALQWIEEALAGDAETVIDSVNEILSVRLPQKLDDDAFTGEEVLARLLDVDGAESELDADTLDGLHAASFARLDAPNAGALEVERIIAKYSVGGDQDSIDDFPNGIYLDAAVNWSDAPLTDGALLCVKHNTYRSFVLGVDSGNNVYVRNQRQDGFGDWLRLWTDQDQVDADTVDGKHASELQNYNNLTNRPSIGAATITITAGNAMSGGGTFSANQTSAKTVTINHADTSSQGSVNNSGRTFIQDVTLDGYGHVTNLNSSTFGGDEAGAAYALTGSSSVGSLVFAYYTSSVNFGSSVAGSSLTKCCVRNGGAIAGSGSLSGTWRCLGHIPSGATGAAATIFKRIS